MTQLRKVADGLRTRFPRAATVLEEAAEDILACRHLPLEHQRQLHSTNPLERLNKEIKRRSNVVGIFPNPAAVIRLVGAILLEQDDEWAVAERRYFSADGATNFHHLTGHYPMLYITTRKGLFRIQLKTAGAGWKYLTINQPKTALHVRGVRYRA